MNRSGRRRIGCRQFAGTRYPGMPHCGCRFQTSFWIPREAFRDKVNELLVIGLQNLL